MEWLSNPWVIGILGSIPSGFLVNWATGYILGKRENREYLQKVLGANREVVYAIRPGISEGDIPSVDVLTALVNSTARRYGVESSDLYTPSQISEELVKEVMDSSFITSAQKAEYCARLATLGANSRRELTDSINESARDPKAIAEYRSRLVSSMSMLLGLLTASTTVMVSLLELVRSQKLNTSITAFSDDPIKLSILLPALIAMTTMAVTMIVFLFYRDVTRRRRNAIEDESREAMQTIYRTRRDALGKTKGT